MDAETLDRLAAAEAAAQAGAAQVAALQERTAELERELRAAVGRGASAAGAGRGPDANKRLVRAPVDTALCYKPGSAAEPQSPCVTSNCC